MNEMGIKFWNRDKKKHEEEKVFGGWGVNFFYKTRPGFLLERSFFSKKPLSHCMGFFNNSWYSRSRIPSFVKNYGIPMEDYCVPEPGFTSFNDFFIRKFKDGKRDFPKDEKKFGSPAEGRLLIFPAIEKNQTLFIKDQKLSVAEILKNKDLAHKFEGGQMAVIRLCPVDYHRFHFPDSGKAQASVRVQGVLHSVNPAALEKLPKVFEENERQVTLLESDHFGEIAIVEVGALGVGKILQTFSPGKIERGQEKGYFLFGASTLVFFVQKNKIQFDEDLVRNSKEGIETLVKVGEAIASRAEKTAHSA